MSKNKSNVKERRLKQSEAWKEKPRGVRVQVVKMKRKGNIVDAVIEKMGNVKPLF